VRRLAAQVAPSLPARWLRPCAKYAHPLPRRPARASGCARRPKLLPSGAMAPFRRFRGTDTYLTNEALEAAVNCALALERPLLVKGEPGTGKTLLAEAISSALGAELIPWHVKSTTRAQDGLYVYDTVQRLYDSRFGDGDVRDIRRYIKLGPLGRALKEPKRVVLLIDEIDKADLEFPNDLLHELDRMRFRINETGDEIVAAERPVVVITSNNEKELPDAFLRRCVFHFIDFPDPAFMRRIVAVHHPELEQELVEQTLKAFYEIRGNGRIRKRPSTSELVDWIAVLKRAGIKEVRFDSGLPFLGALLKKEQDLAALADQLAGGRKYRS
jgi:MoxR-like ATPase